MNKRSIHIPVMLEENNESWTPHYASSGAAGADLKARVEQEVELLPGQSLLVPTGVSVAIPEGFEIQIRPRSGLALKKQVTVLNTPGTIDSDYRGEVGVILINHSSEPFTIAPGMRIAQMVLCPVFQAHFVQVEALEETERAAGGFGHTGSH